MRKNFGRKTWFFPMPVLIVGTYDGDGNPDAMNAAWGGVYDAGHVMLSLDAGRRTTKNILLRKAFTVSFGDAAHAAACDYVGLVSADEAPDKLKKAGFTAEKSGFVDAPLIRELPLALECRLSKTTEDGNIIGKIVNVSADESVLDGDGLVSAEKLQAIAFDGVHAAYLRLGEKIGRAFHDGNALK